VAAIAQHHIEAAPGPAGLAAHGWHGLEQRDQLGDIVAVSAGQGCGERDTGRVGDQMVLTARPAPVDGTSARPGSPFGARMWEP
jgi:hypothetical protein